ncbi:MAG: AEC family transporter [Acidobacteriia bacterium]|nr:AEC family transporter [Terriglobia bacterium]
MAGWSLVLFKILSLLPVIGIGWVAARRGWLAGGAVSSMSRLAVDVALPALTFTQLVRTVSRDSILASGLLPVAGAALFLLGAAAGFAVAPFFCDRATRPTFVFLVALANSIYLPLPIAQALYGGEGVRTVLLCEVGTRVAVFSVGLAILIGRKPDARSVREILVHPGLLSALAGIAAPLLFPGLRALPDLDPRGAAPAAMAGYASFQALDLAGALTIPLALLVTGAKLEEVTRGGAALKRATWGVLLARLLAAPAAVAALLFLAQAAGAKLDEVPRRVVFLVACMPVAVNCGVFTERYGGDSTLAARSTFASTLLGVLTIPLLFFAAQRLGL